MITWNWKVNFHSKNIILFLLFYVTTLEMQTENANTLSKHLPTIHIKTQLGTYLVTLRDEGLGYFSGLTSVLPELCSGEKREHHEQRDCDRLT